MASHREEFLSRAKKYNVELDDQSLESSGKLKALGLDFDLQLKRYRLDPDWITRRSDSWRAWWENHRSGVSTPLRSTLEVYGALIWASNAKRVPLWTYAEGLACLTDTAKKCGSMGFDAPHTLPDYAIANTAKWISDVTRNEWTTPTSGCVSGYHVIVSDASDVGTAFVELMGNAIISAGSRPRTDGEIIFLAETAALCEGAEASLDPLTALYCTDNQALHFALRKGHSSSYLANCMLRRTFGVQKPESMWIPSDCNITDGASRGGPLPNKTEIEAFRPNFHLDTFGDRESE